MSEAMEKEGFAYEVALEADDDGRDRHLKAREVTNHRLGGRRRVRQGRRRIRNKNNIYI